MKNLQADYRICNRCVMDTTDPDISFDDRDFCNHCTSYKRIVGSEAYQEKSSPGALDIIVDEIREAGKGKQYDCIVGLSGGTDSSYVIYSVKRIGLRPLAVHLDNGWNSDLAVCNIKNLLDKLDIDLYTYVIDWEVFRDLQVAFLRSSTPDVEITSDHAIRATLWQVAESKGVKYVIHGRNKKTEGILPGRWGYGPLDWKYIKTIHKRFGQGTLKGYPHVSLPVLFYYLAVKRITDVGILDYVSYNKKEATAVLTQKFGWRAYGGKHYESIITRFFQAYILPRKFNYDKRKAYLSVLIMAGEVSRDQVLQVLRDEPTCDPDIMEEDKQYVLKKLCLGEQEFEGMMAAPSREYSDYPNNAWILHPHKSRIFHLVRHFKSTR